MKRRRSTFNPKRSLGKDFDQHELAALAARVNYGGNPEHKRNPGDFNLTPPAQPRANKTLCDGVNIFSRVKAQKLLQLGIKRGLISKQTKNGYPQNIWSVANGEPLEAQLENSGQGTYHGYPMSPTDPFREAILTHWDVP